MRRPRVGCGPGGCGGGGGGDPDRRALWVLAVVAGSMALAGIVWGAGLMASRGANVRVTSCEWDSVDKAYVAMITVENTEDRPKVVKTNVRFSLNPRKGQLWPSEQARIRFATFTLPSGFSLAARETLKEQRVSTFPVPVEGFSCKATADISTQERLPKSG